MAQLKSTNINGNLSVAGNAQINGDLKIFLKDDAGEEQLIEFPKKSGTVLTEHPEISIVQDDELTWNRYVIDAEFNDSLFTISDVYRDENGHITDFVINEVMFNMPVLPTDYLTSSSNLNASKLASGTIPLARIPTGTASTQVALGNHTHSSYAPTSHASSAATYGVGTTANYGHLKISTGDMSTLTFSNGIAAGIGHTHSNYLTSSSSIAYSQLPTGTSDSTVAIGSHTHSGYLTSSSNLSASKLSSGTVPAARLPIANQAGTAAGALYVFYDSNTNTLDIRTSAKSS